MARLNKRAPAISAALIASACVLFSQSARASDHLDSPTVIADPRVDIGDVYAWTAPDAARLNLVMTIVGHSFSDRATYTLHVDSGPAFGRTPRHIALTCRFPRAELSICTLGRDQAQGDARNESGLQGRRGSFRIFAGLRNDPFFNNVRGTRAAYQVAAQAIAAGAAPDRAGCTAFPPTTVTALADAWRHTDGGPARDFLAQWTPSVIAATVDLRAVARGGPIVAVWGSTSVGRTQIDRAARPLTGNALLGTLASADDGNRMRRPGTRRPRRTDRALQH